MIGDALSSSRISALSLTSMGPPITGKPIAIDPLQLVVPVVGAGGVIDQRQRLAGFVDAEAGRHQRLVDP
ncbi:MAG: hypothetical protein ACXWZI_03395, partial [Mycobacterium sp.]